MKILLIGHKGMLGTDLMKILETSHEVTGKDIDDVRIEHYDEVRDLIHTLRPECVINAAAYTDVEGCETQEEQSYKVNVLGVKNIATVCSEIKAKIVHFSTDYVFDGKSDVSYDEEDSCNALNVYGRHKYESEKVTREISDDFLIIRTAWLYGKTGKNFVRTILDKAGKVKPLRVVNDQRGSPTYSVDLAAATALLVERRDCGLYHVVNRGSCSWYEFAVEILSCAGIEDAGIIPVMTRELKLKAQRPSRSVLSTRKFTEATGKTLRFWQFALRDYVEVERGRILCEAHKRREE